MNNRIVGLQGILVVLLMMLTGLSSVFASELDSTLFTYNRVSNLSDNVIVEAANGLDDAVMDIVSLDVNLSVLEKGSYQDRIKEDIRLVGQNFNISLPGYNDTLRFNVDKLNTNKFGVDTYVGHINDNYKHFFVFTVKDGILTGSININQNLFIINSHYQGRDFSQSLTWYDQRYFDKSHNLNDTSQPNHSKKYIETQNPYRLNYVEPLNNYHVVRTLFYFGSDVSNPYQLAANVINRMNLALYNSGIPETYFFTISDIVILNSDFGTDCRGKILEHMNFETHEFTQIVSKRNNSKSDIVISVAKGNVPITTCSNQFVGRFGGQAILNLVSELPNLTFADNWAIADDTAVHEIGHVLNGWHSVIDPSDLPSNNQGITTIISTNPDEGEQSIMGGYQVNNCDVVFSSNPINQDCPRVLSFSNQRPPNDFVNFPRKFSDGSLIGAPNRNNATYFTQTAIPTVSYYRPDPAPPTGAPSLSITSHQCYGLNDLNWSSISNATFYIVYKSFDYSFPNHHRFYIGLNNNLFINIPSQIPRYYRVKACNSGGCGPDSNTVTGNYVNYCM